jgi:hypothetical protein
MVWRRTEVGTVVVARGGNAVVVEVGYFCEEVFTVFRGCVSCCVEPFPFEFVCCLNFACLVFRLSFCVLVSGGPVHLTSRSGVGV